MTRPELHPLDRVARSGRFAGQFRSGTRSLRDYCLPDSYVMEISIESLDPANARVVGILSPSPPRSPPSTLSLSLSLDLSFSPCPCALTWAGASVFLGRLAITRPPALTIPATIGKAQYRTYGGSGRRGAADGRNGKRVLEARTNNRISSGVRGICSNSRNTLE